MEETAVKEFTQLLDKNIDRFTDKVNELSPTAEHLWQQMIGYHVLESYGYIVSNWIIVCIGVYLTIHFNDRYKNATKAERKRDYDESKADVYHTIFVLSVIISIFWSFVSVYITVKGIAIINFPESVILREMF